MAKIHSCNLHPYHDEWKGIHLGSSVSHQPNFVAIAFTFLASFCFTMNVPLLKWLAVTSIGNARLKWEQKHFGTNAWKGRGKEKKINLYICAFELADMFRYGNFIMTRVIFFWCCGSHCWPDIFFFPFLKTLMIKNPKYQYCTLTSSLFKCSRIIMLEFKSY